VLALISAGVLMFVSIPKPPPRSVAGDGRPLSEIARQPRFVVAVVCGVASYAMMNLVMTSAPLAMVVCNHSVTEATLGLQWHVLGMYAPSFVTGALISRFGSSASSAWVWRSLSPPPIDPGISPGTSGLALFARRRLNFAFIGATTMVKPATGRTSATRCRPSTIFSCSPDGIGLPSGKPLASFG
jgi:hypothetical protein